MFSRQNGHLVRPREIEVEGNRVVFSVAGSGDPLVLVHGLSGSSRWWWRNIPALSKHFTVYLLDLPGFGTMRRYSAGFVLSKAAEWLAAWLRAVGIQPVHIVGHSLGGYISIRLAARHAELVRRIILVAPAGIPQDRPLLGYSIPLLRAATQLRPRFATVLARDFLRAGPMTILQAARELLTEDICEDLERIRHPTLLIWGAEDPMIPASIGPVLRARIGDSRLLVIEGVGHVPMIDRADEFNAAVLTFLNGGDIGE